MTAIDVLKELNEACYGFWSTEKPKTKASNSELRRWLDKGSVKINGAFCKAFDEIDQVLEIVLFPKNDRKRISFRF